MKSINNSILILSILGMSTIACSQMKLQEPKNESMAISNSITQQAAAPLGECMSSVQGMPIQDLHMSIDSRFMNRLNKEDIASAKTIHDILPKGATENLIDFQEVYISRFDKPRDVRKGNSEKLTREQLELLNELDYSQDFYLNAPCFEYDPVAKMKKPYTLVYYVSVVPKTIPFYDKSNKNLIDLIKGEIEKEAMVLERDYLDAGSISFTISKDGKLKNLNIDRSSGYLNLDNLVYDYLNTKELKWVPGKDSNGNPVDQQLVFSYGLAGC